MAKACAGCARQTTKHDAVSKAKLKISLPAAKNHHRKTEPRVLSLLELPSLEDQMQQNAAGVSAYVYEPVCI